MSDLFPVMMDLGSRKAVVFGGGRVARRRAAKLLKAGAKVRVVSREFEAGFEDLEVGGIELVEAEVTGDDIGDYLEGAFLAVAATDDPGLNSRIEEEARRRGILVNRADGVSDLVFPAVIEEGDVVISISSSGRSPGLTKALKKRIRKVLTREDLAQLELQEYLRAMLKKGEIGQRKRERILREVMNMPEILDYLKKGDLSRAKEAARRIADAHH
ncbi:MAG: bifunctional precorrin-2 dehydrogenase/sirohydrochlorin ferrochelatase [Euryarchaeota archaeon]|nr:bifunctional precorrin-2 dehydrogenase/sirohydrochlorin ferrochelatase [Euryarchaeota archaeon]